MDLSIFFASVESIATSLERIADHLDTRGATPAADSAPARESLTPKPPARRRRTKEEIAADEAQAQALVQSGAPVVAPDPAAAQAAAAQAAAAQAAAAQAAAAQAAAAQAAAAQAAAQAAALPRPVAGLGEVYHALGVQDQFTQLNLLVGPYFVSAPSVKTALIDTLAKHGVGLPLSDINDQTRSTPGANFTGMTNLARIEVYENCARAIDAHNAANGL